MLSAGRALRCLVLADSRRSDSGTGVAELSSGLDRRKVSRRSFGHPVAARFFLVAIKIAPSRVTRRP